MKQFEMGYEAVGEIDSRGDRGGLEGTALYVVGGDLFDCAGAVARLFHHYSPDHEWMRHAAIAESPRGGKGVREHISRHESR